MPAAGAPSGIYAAVTFKVDPGLCSQSQPGNTTPLSREADRAGQWAHAAAGRPVKRRSYGNAGENGYLFLL